MLRTKRKVVITFYGKDLLKAREAADLSQGQLAGKVGYWSQQRISAIENKPGKHFITSEQLDLICQFV